MTVFILVASRYAEIEHVAGVFSTRALATGAAKSYNRHTWHVSIVERVIDEAVNP